MTTVPNPTCTVEGCERSRRTRGYCNAHYQRVLVGKDLSRPILERNLMSSTCSIPGCPAPTRYTGLCSAHYQRRLKGQAPGAQVQIPMRVSECVISGCDRKPTPSGACAMHGARARTYSLSVLQLDAILLPDTCEACGRSGAVGRTLHIDHDHSCCPGPRSCGNCVRGLVCEPCNKGFGHFDDDVERMKKAIAYLSR